MRRIKPKKPSCCSDPYLSIFFLLVVVFFCVCVCVCRSPFFFSPITAQSLDLCLVNFSSVNFSIACVVMLFFCVCSNCFLLLVFFSILFYAVGFFCFFVFSPFSRITVEKHFTAYRIMANWRKNQTIK